MFPSNRQPESSAIFTNPANLLRALAQMKLNGAENDAVALIIIAGLARGKEFKTALKNEVHKFSATICEHVGNALAKKGLDQTKRCFEPASADLKEAKFWLTQAYKAGNESASVKMIDLNLLSNDVNEALKLICEGIRKGLGDVSNYAYLCLVRNRITRSADRVRVIDELENNIQKLPAIKASTIAMFFGDAYFNGSNGRSQSLDKALHYASLALADEKQTGAYVLIGQVYNNKKFSGYDPTEAMKNFAIGWKKSDPYCGLKYALLLMREKEAISIAEAAAILKEVSAQRNEPSPKIQALGYLASLEYKRKDYLKAQNLANEALTLASRLTSSCTSQFLANICSAAKLVLGTIYCEQVGTEGSVEVGEQYLMDAASHQPSALSQLYYFRLKSPDPAKNVSAFDLEDQLISRNDVSALSINGSRALLKGARGEDASIAIQQLLTALDLGEPQVAYSIAMYLEKFDNSIESQCVSMVMYGIYNESMNAATRNQTVQELIQVVKERIESLEVAIGRVPKYAALLPSFHEIIEGWNPLTSSVEQDLNALDLNIFTMADLQRPEE